MNSLFNSKFSTSNPFSIGMDEATNDLSEMYAKLEAMKNQQIQQRNNVFTDISNEFQNLTEDEQNFILSSEEYQKINLKYQTEFSEFLTQKFANEYLQQGNQRTLEEMLFVIRKRKEQYKSKFAEDINEIRTQNKSLLDKNDELANANIELQKQLKEIQDKLNVR